MKRATLTLALPLVMAAAPLDSQRLPDDERDEPVATRLVLRAGGGALNPDDPFNATVALHGEVGLEWGHRRALLLRYLRQSANGNEGEDLDEAGRGFLTASLEWGFGDVAQHVQQYRVRLGGGAVLRPYDLSTAPALEMAAVIRYLLVGRLALTGFLGDVVAFLPRDRVTVCGTVFCRTYEAGGKHQHNFALLVALEWKL